MTVNEIVKASENIAASYGLGYNQAIMDAYKVCEQVLPEWCPKNLSNTMLLEIVERLTDLVDSNAKEVEATV